MTCIQREGIRTVFQFAETKRRSQEESINDPIVSSLLQTKLSIPSTLFFCLPS